MLIKIRYMKKKRTKQKGKGNKTQSGINKFTDLASLTALSRELHSWDHTVGL